jgi:DNA-binding MarR family transcriptional regulator
MNSLEPALVQSGSAIQADDFWPLFIRFALSQKAWWGTVCADFDLTPTQGHALRSLDPDHPVAMSTLAESLSCEPSNITGVVDKLESRGYIARQSVGHDRRIKMLVVTAEGVVLQRRLWERMEEPPPAVAALPPAFKQQLAGVLRDVLAGRGAIKG